MLAESWIVGSLILTNGYVEDIVGEVMHQELGWLTLYLLHSFAVNLKLL